MSSHVCVYRRRAVPVGTREEAGLLVTEYSYRFLCEHDVARETRRIPGIAFVETATTEPGAAPQLAANQLEFARKLLSRLAHTTGWTRVDRFLGRLSSTYPAFDQAFVLQGLCRAGLLELRQEVDKILPTFVQLADANRFEDMLDPGRRQRLEDAKSWARTLLPTPGPATQRLYAELDTMDAWPPDAVRAAAVLCLLSDIDLTLPMRTASSWFFGDTKVLEDHVDRASAWLGDDPVRPHEPMTFLGGVGQIMSPATIQFGPTLPFIALPRSAIRTAEIRFPTGGLAVIEGKTCFEEACKGRIAQLTGRLCLWSGGQPGPDVERIVRAAREKGAPVCVWYDLDGEGILGARLIDGWAGKASPINMDVAAARSAPVHRSLTGSKWKTAQLQARQEGSLQELAQHLVDSHTWVEQEALLEAEALTTLRGLGVRLYQP